MYSKKILTNQFVIFLIVSISFGNLVHFSYNRNTDAIATFFAILFIMSFFVRDIVVILSIALVIVNIIFYSNNEGFITQEYLDEMYDNMCENKKSCSEKIECMRQIVKDKDNVIMGKQNKIKILELDNERLEKVGKEFSKTIYGLKNAIKTVKTDSYNYWENM